jgi:hypothetical protein
MIAKLKYHKKNIFALQTLNIKEHVNVVDTKEDVFKDYGAILDTFYGTFKPGTIKKTHISSGRHGCITVDAMFYSFGGNIRRASDVEKRAGEGRQDKSCGNGSL